MELVIRCLSKQYGNKIANDRIDLTMKQGVYGLLGPNGSGKTTLMRMLCGVLTPTAGEVTFDGIPASHEDYRDKLGYLPQDYGYYPEFSARDFLLYLAQLKGLSKEKARMKAAELLEVVSLSGEAKKKIKTFSGGMKQRLGIAQALLNDPQILILDEPTAGLDPKERVRFRNMISQLGASRIVLLSTHIVSDIEYIADQILIMKEGRIIHCGTMDQVLQHIQGKVWEVTVDAQEAEALMTHHTVINIRHEGTKVFLRLTCDGPPNPAATPVTATLEDLYLSYFNQEVTK